MPMANNVHYEYSMPVQIRILFSVTEYLNRDFSTHAQKSSPVYVYVEPNSDTLSDEKQQLYTSDLIKKILLSV